MCDGKIRGDACHITYRNDVIIKRTGTENDSGGKCTSPKTCTGCNDGFYSDGPHCRSKCFFLYK